MYEPVVPPKLSKTLSKIKKRDPETYKEFKRKMVRILNDPHHNSHPLHSEYKGLWESHIKNKLLLYKINDIDRTVELVDIIDHADL